ncbi:MULTISPECIES: fimbrial protein [Comamonas]|uniref:fimbrial protein n=1 Tax=Comamonas TaxID=283 RepID=UPI0015FAC4B7|nr:MULTISPECIES: fimbrial protein [Comamonas]UUC92014.1 type 1 fimbrial protein [Comamonas sp. C11]WEE76047.1 type 1 fimbrial protein [Comamonas testosteroni]
MANQRFRKRRLMPVILQFLCTSFLVAAPMVAKAEGICIITMNDGRLLSVLDWQIQSWDTGDFDPSVPVGSVINTKKIRLTGESGFIECKTPFGATRYSGIGQPGSYDTFTTSIAGVGIRMKLMPSLQWWPQTWYDNRTRYYLTDTQELTVELVKTGPITSGGYIGGLIGEGRYVDLQYTFRRFYIEGRGIAVEPKVPTCKLNTSLVTVPLDGISVSDLMDNGKGPWKDFTLNLTCSGGGTGATTRMFIVFSDAQNPANRSTTLSLSGDSVAKNVGIEIQRENDQLVRFGPESEEVHQWKVGEFGNGPVDIKLKARYTWTSLVQRPTPGSANADATFVISYK